MSELLEPRNTESEIVEKGEFSLKAALENPKVKLFSTSCGNILSFILLLTSGAEWTKYFVGAIVVLTLMSIYYAVIVLLKKREVNLETITLIPQNGEKELKTNIPTLSGNRETLSEENKPKTLHEFFRTDFNAFIIHRAADINFNVAEKSELVTVRIELQLLVDLIGKSEYIAYYIPATIYTFAVCQAFARSYKEAFTLTKDGLHLEGGFGDEVTTSKELRFTGRIYIYHETALIKEQKEKLTKLFKQKKLSLILRDASYAFHRNHLTYNLQSNIREKKAE